MANKRFWLGILVIVLVFGMMVVGCNDDTTNGNGNGDTYDPTGTWDISGTNATVTITGTNWMFNALNPSDNDTGTYDLSGNVATLYSNSWSANIGTATLTSNTTLILTLHAPSGLTGTFNGTKR